MPLFSSPFYRRLSLVLILMGLSARLPSAAASSPVSPSSFCLLYLNTHPHTSLPEVNSALVREHLQSLGFSSFEGGDIFLKGDLAIVLNKNGTVRIFYEQLYAPVGWKGQPGVKRWPAERGVLGVTKGAGGVPFFLTTEQYDVDWIQQLLRSRALKKPLAVQLVNVGFQFFQTNAYVFLGNSKSTFALMHGQDLSRVYQEINEDTIAALPIYFKVISAHENELVIQDASRQLSLDNQDHGAIRQIEFLNLSPAEIEDLSPEKWGTEVLDPQIRSYYKIFIEKDSKYLSTQGVSREAIGQIMQGFQNFWALNGQGGNAELIVGYRGIRFRISGNRIRGYYDSPAPFSFQSDLYLKIENLNSGDSIEFTGYMPELIGRFGFYGDVQAGERLEPRALLKVFPFLRPSSPKP